VAIALEVQPHLPLFGGCLECIVLNACCTGGKDASEGRLGDLLHQMGAPSVVCWGSPADNVACAYFAAGMGAALMQRSTRPPAAHDGAGHASAKGANDDDAASYASADDAPRSIYASAFERGKRNVCAVPMSSAVPGARTQRFMFVDPTDPTKVIQPADVAAGHAEPRALYRVRSGVGAGRVAAGLPILLENASLTDAGARPVRRRVPTAAEGTPGTAPRLLWGIALVGIALGGLALLAALGVGGGPLAPFGARSGAATTLSQPVPLADRPPLPLVTVDSQGRLSLHPGALAAIRGAPGSMCVVGVAGPAGEGTSTLANAIVSVLRPLASPEAPAPAPSAVVSGTAGGRSAHAVASSAHAVGFAIRSAGEGVGGEGIWMWLSDAPPAHLNRSCGSVLVLDTAPISGTSLLPANARYGAAASDGARQRMLSFLLLAASKVAINVRRQPPLELLERLVGAALAANAVRPMEDAADEVEAAAAAAAGGGPSCAGDGGRTLPALPPPPTARDCDEGEAVHVAAGTAYGGAAPDPPSPPDAYDRRAALVMVLRDSLESVGSPTAAAEAAATAAAAAAGAAESATAAAAHAAAYAAEAARAARSAAVWSRWLPGSAGRALRAAVRSTDLLSIRPPTEADLRQLEVNGMPRQRMPPPSPPPAAPAQHGAPPALDTAEAAEERAWLAEVAIETAPSTAPSPAPSPPPLQQQPASSFTGALARSALDLTSELRPLRDLDLTSELRPLRELDGAALAAWMEHVASRLNALEAGTKLQGV